MIRPLLPEQISQLAAHLSHMDPWRHLGYTAAALETYLRRPDPSLTRMVLWRDHHLCGVVALRSPWLRGPYIELLAVLPNQQSQGAGRRLVQWATQQPNSGNLWACVSGFNHPARRFYAQLGFQEVAPLHGLVLDGHEEILLRMTLTKDPS